MAGQIYTASQKLGEFGRGPTPWRDPWVEQQALRSAQAGVMLKQHQRQASNGLRP